VNRRHRYSQYHHLIVLALPFCCDAFVASVDRMSGGPMSEQNELRFRKILMNKGRAISYP
jgi:hypothetical protein